MKRVFALIISILIAGSAITACQPYQYYGKYPELFSVFVCAIPGAGNGNCWKLKKIDEDSYGRVLFWHAQSIFHYRNEGLTFGYVVCQHYDGKKAYYLQDISFEIADSLENITEERIEKLKQRNNWEQPLDLEVAGMKSTELFTSFKQFKYLDWETTKECTMTRADKLPQMLKEQYPDDFSVERLSVFCFDIYEDMRALYLVKAVEKNSKSCIIALYSDGTLYEGSPLWIDDPFSEEYIEQLVKFRAEFEAASEKNG